MNALVEEIANEQLKSDIPEFDVGDTVRVHLRIIEGDKERIQALTGTVIARKGKGIAETFSIYRVAYGASMERVFPLHSPRVAKIEVMRKGKTRRSKLYFLRGLQGKKARIAEKITAKPVAEKKAAAPAVEEPKAEAPAPVVEEPKVEAPAEEPKKAAKPKAKASEDKPKTKPAAKKRDDDAEKAPPSENDNPES